MAKVFQQQPKGAAASSHPEAFRFQVSRRTVSLLIVLPALLFLGAGGAGFWLGTPADATRPAEAQDFKSVNPVVPVGFRTGPWGAMEVQPSYLQIPDECLPGLASLPAPRWVFKGYSKQRVLALFASAGLNAEDLRGLEDSRLWQVDAGGTTLTPPQALILALTPAERGIIYTALAQFPDNALQHSPFFWKTADETELFTRHEFSAPVRALLRQLSYQKGNLTVFADWETLAQLRPAPEPELRKTLKALSGKPAAIARLRISPETDLAAMMRYWGVSGLTKVMQPALEAVTRIPQGRTVTMLAVLPPFARERLNTYPGSANDNDGQDSFWTTFNFFQDKPTPPGQDPAQWRYKLTADYFTVFTDPRYGDILIIARPTGEVIQTAVYLANDLVFTRLGPTRWEPWTIMSVADLLEISAIRLAHQEMPAVSYYRNRVL